MKIRFWGVRGSIPSPGAHTARYGGNTMCISVKLDSGHTLILDAGSGLYQLGQQATAAQHVYFFLLSHMHWDHIHGFPMFRPHMNPDVTIKFFTEMNPDWEEEFFCQLDGVHFPISRNEIKATVESADNVNASLSKFGLDVSWIQLNHRGLCYGYKISSSSGTLVYITDHELDAKKNVHSSFDEVRSFCSGANVLIHDAQYTTEELHSKAGWGHSSPERACDLAAAAEVGRLILCHHDPKRSDHELDQMVERVNGQLSSDGANFKCEAAFEGLEFEL